MSPNQDFEEKERERKLRRSDQTGNNVTNHTEIKGRRWPRRNVSHLGMKPCEGGHSTELYLDGGPNKDSDKRQRAAITAFAKAHGYRIVDEFYDAAVSGADPIAERPGFRAMLDRIAHNGVAVQASHRRLLLRQGTTPSL